MKSIEFNNVFERICKYYGKDEYINDIAIRDIYFKEMQFIVPERWEKIETLLFKKCKFMPKVADINEVSKTVASEKPVIEHKDCNICGGIGYVVIKRVIDNYPYEYAYLCTCGNAPKYDGRIIKDTEHRSQFYTKSIEELPEYESLKMGVLS